MMAQVLEEGSAEAKRFAAGVMCILHAGQFTKVDD